MKNKKILVIGGSRNIGLDIVNHFKGMSISRSNGYDIKEASGRKKAAEFSLNYNVVVNHAYTGDFSQLLMLKELCLFMERKRERRLHYQHRQYVLLQIQ